MGVGRRAAPRRAFPLPLHFGYGGAMPPLTNPRARFAAAVQADDTAIDLAEVALLIAAEAYPELDLGRYRATLDALGDGARAHVGAADSDPGRVRALIHYLAREQRFVGNQDDYYDRRNSFLNEVLDRRTGIPITLAVVYIEVGRRAGLAVDGIGFPGHFLTKLRGEAEIVFDPFFGQVLSEEQCARRLQAVMGQETSFDRSYLRSATTREILVRMLRNLKQIYLQAREYEPALACSERILLVQPELPQELRDRGLLYQQLECFSAAQADLERFLALAPNDDSAEVVREKLIEIRRHGGSTLH
jgi:regulator of sirC expression with transglutaminase-like and TPR domain